MLLFNIDSHFIKIMSALLLVHVLPQSFHRLKWSWWRHQMEALSALLAFCEGNSPVTGESPHTGQWRGAFMFSLFCAWTHGSANLRDAGNLRLHRTLSWRHGDVNHTVVLDTTLYNQLIYYCLHFSRNKFIKTWIPWMNHMGCVIPRTIVPHH